MDDRALWELMSQTHGAIAAYYRPMWRVFTAEGGGMLLAAFAHDPKAVTPAYLRVRDPYTAIGVYQARLATAAEKGGLVEEKPGVYRLTEVGRAKTQRFIEEARAAMAEADPLPPADGERLAHLLGRLVQAALDTPPPPEPWAIGIGYRLMPALTPPLPYSEQAISCLHGYRDDAHLAAWRPSGLSAPALESLTFLWRGEADSLDTLVERLAHRGHPRRVYAEALVELRRRGLVEGPDDAPRLTEAGRRFRDRVEADTDRLFFAPWGCLDEAEKGEVAHLLTRLRDGLKEGAW